MTTNDDMTPRQPDEGEPLEDLLGDEIDRIDQAVARITDAEVNERLRKALRQAGYIGQFSAQRPRLIDPSAIADLLCQNGPAMAPEHAAVADLLATARANAKLSWEKVELSGQRLKQAEEALEIARQKAEQIVATAHEEADEALDKALKEAAKIVREAREQAGRIINDAYHKTAQARDVVLSLNGPRVVYLSVDGDGEVKVSRPQTRWPAVPREVVAPEGQFAKLGLEVAHACQETGGEEAWAGNQVARPGIIIAQANGMSVKIHSGSWQPSSPGAAPVNPAETGRSEWIRLVYAAGQNALQSHYPTTRSAAGLGEDRGDGVLFFVSETPGQQEPLAAMRPTCAQDRTLIFGHPMNVFAELRAVLPNCLYEDRGDGFLTVGFQEIPTAQIIDPHGIRRD